MPIEPSVGGMVPLPAAAAGRRDLRAETAVDGLWTPSKAGSTAAVLVVGALVAAGLQQGGFFARGQLAAGAFVAAALLAALPVRRSELAQLRTLLLAGGLFAGWALARAVPDGSGASAVREVLLVSGLAAVLVVCQRLSASGRDVVLAGTLAFGALLALLGWAGVVWHHAPWALPAHGLWGAASTISYANATAAVLVPLAIVTLALFSAKRRSALLGVTLMLLLLGAGLTLSRAGALTLLLGVALLAALRGSIVLGALLGPACGALLAAGGALPSLRVGAESHPLLAAVGLVAGLAVTAVAARGARGRWTPAIVAGTVIAAGVVGAWTAGPPLLKAGERVLNHRVEASSPNRSATNRAALRVAARHPFVGVGPGRLVLETRGKGDRLRVQRYAHNEYVQTLAELGAVGAVLLAALIVCTARLLCRARTFGSDAALWAGVVAASAAAGVHAGLDFVWHVPVVPLTVAVLIGLGVTSATESGPNGRRPS